MASCKQSFALLLAVLGAAGTSSSAAGGVPACGQIRKITVQNLCGHDLPLSLAPVAGSPHLFGPSFVLHRGTHESFPVCWCTGRLSAPGAPVAELQLGVDGGAWYKATFSQMGPVHVTVTPHADPARGGRLEGHCPAIGCGAGNGRCSRDEAPGGDCHNVDELKIIYYSP